MKMKFEVEEETKKKKSRCLVIWWRLFIFIFTVAVIGVIGGLVGYYIFLQDQEKPNQAQPTEDPSAEAHYYVGVARHDVTGPIVQVNMMGYAHPEQIAAGLHTRLYSRAYVIADATMKNRVAFVSFDGGMASQLLKLEVVKRLREKHGDIFTEKNVVISGTHTHSGPAGYFQYLLFEVTSLGHVKQSTDTLVNGIVESIEAANTDLRKARIRLGKANVDTGNINRSPTSYLLNPTEERARYTHDTDQEISVLRFDSIEGDPLGMVTWYPVHPTNMNFSNLLINSDNKGRASMLVEKIMRKDGETQTGKESFVAAFAAANLGDVSPRTNGPICVETGDECEPLSSSCNNKAQDCIAFGPGKDMFESTDIIARRQVDAALRAYHSADLVVKGPISWVHQYVDMANASAPLENGTIVTSCRPGMGYSFAAGCTDGAGGFDFIQGMTAGTRFWDAVRDVVSVLVCSEQPTDEYYQCHQPKPVLLPTGYMDIPRAWHPTIVDVQILRLGQFLVGAVPGEYSTMAGRRLREGLIEEALLEGMPEDTHVVIGGLSNVYTHYITTPEEYRAQRYEAASVIFGENTFAVYQSKYRTLLSSMLRNQEEIDSGPQPILSAPNQTAISPLPGPDKLPDNASFGDVINDVNMTYAAGDMVTVKFQGANPRHNMKLGLTYLEVQRKMGEKWVTEYTDADWSTRLHWNTSDDVRLTMDDVNLFSALFDVIADVTGMWFDFARAKSIGENSWIEDVFEGDNSHFDQSARQRIIQKLKSLKLLHSQPEIASMAETSQESFVTIEWEIPFDQVLGNYRIVYYGDYMNEDRMIVPFNGTSSTFTLS